MNDIHTYYIIIIILLDLYLKVISYTPGILPKFVKKLEICK